MRGYRYASLHHLHVSCARDRHPQVAARHLLDAPGRRPCALLQLELAPFDVEAVALGRESLQLDEERAGAMLRPDDADGGDENENRRNQRRPKRNAVHAATFSATRNTALRARGLRSISAAL